MTCLDCGEEIRGHGGRQRCAGCSDERRREKDRQRNREIARKNRRIVSEAKSLVKAWRSSDGEGAAHAMKRLGKLIPLILVAVALSLGADAQICDRTAAGLSVDGRTHCEPLSASCREVLPTPTVTGDWPTGLDDPREGIRVYYREPGGQWQLACERTCQLHVIDETLELDPRLWCTGVSAPIALQRCASLVPGRLYQFGLKAWNDAGESPGIDSYVEVCWPDTCEFGAACAD